MEGSRGAYTLVWSHLWSLHQLHSQYMSVHIWYVYTHFCVYIMSLLGITLFYLTDIGVSESLQSMGFLPDEQAKGHAYTTITDIPPRPVPP